DRNSAYSFLNLFLFFYFLFLLCPFCLCNLSFSMSSYVPSAETSKAGAEREAKQKLYPWIGEWDWETNDNFYLDDVWGTGSSTEPGSGLGIDFNLFEYGSKGKGKSPEYMRKDEKSDSPASPEPASSPTEPEMGTETYSVPESPPASPVGHVGLGINLNTPGIVVTPFSDFEYTQELTMDLIFFRQMYYEETVKHDDTKAELSELKGDYAFLHFRYQDVMTQLELIKMKLRDEKWKKEMALTENQRMIMQRDRMLR
ncbi:hypothetical protein EDC01DRAFT_743104, partial [Geopyxis carbonaria]